ncbi:hypothetical protein KR009_002787 [Drosophila setifemur]|nr:hypothetical protein KR009_002787 [Drosophila setifemur]
MSIVLDVVQQIVLQKAYDLTCEAAIRVIRGKCADHKEAKLPKRKWEKPNNKVRQDVAPPQIKPRPPKVQRCVKFEGRDIPRKNSGSIDPPQCSCMRICRDSYFS